jgi:hypothetical protein
LLDLKGVVVTVYERRVDGPLEGAAGCGFGQSTDGVQVRAITLAEDDRGGSVVGRSVLDGVGLADLDASREIRALGNRDVGSNGSDEGGASEKALDEKHC